MPKIKNWSKVEDNSKKVEWVNSTKEVNNKVTITKRVTGSWNIYYPSSGRNNLGRKKKIVDTKEQARKWAVEWMKNHPQSVKFEGHRQTS